MHEIVENIKTVDLEINDLEKFKTIIAAAETDDELGSVCSGQVKLATVLESFQYKRSDSFGVNPPLY